MAAGLARPVNTPPGRKSWPDRNRFGAVMSWWFAFTRDLRRERTFTTKQVGIVRDVYDDPHLPTSAGADS